MGYIGPERAHYDVLPVSADGPAPAEQIVDTVPSAAREIDVPAPGPAPAPVPVSAG